VSRSISFTSSYLSGRHSPSADAATPGNAAGQYMYGKFFLSTDGQELLLSPKPVDLNDPSLEDGEYGYILIQGADVTLSGGILCSALHAATNSQNSFKVVQAFLGARRKRAEAEWKGSECRGHGACRWAAPDEAPLEIMGLSKSSVARRSTFDCAERFV
jgi:hypothetical protein